ncbi:hypothetical protein A3K73_00980 [Candidatus Pacearchaeota archaeon RBG_13_36_9]|nr:MAG: hypothetical protein A3K73_00980 [Candidatus Pacearchaeota archaeon RBG_13_36_9]
MFFKDKNREAYGQGQEPLGDNEGFVPSGTLGPNENDGYETSKSYEEESIGSSGMSGGFSADAQDSYDAGADYSRDSSPPIIRDPLLARKTLEYSQQNPLSSSVLSDSPDAIVQEFKKMDDKINSIVDWIKEFYERFSPAMEGLAKVKRAAFENEENIDKALRDSARAIELISKIDLEKLRMDSKQLDMEAESNKQAIAQLSEEVESLNERASIFIDTEELLKLNDEVKNSLMQMKNLESEIRERADRIERARKESSANASLELQRTANLAKRNKEAIGNFTFGDYQEKIDTILEVIEKLAGEVSVVKKELSIIKEENNYRSQAKKNEAIEALEDIGVIPELPELPSSKTKKFRKTKKKR